VVVKSEAGVTIIAFDRPSGSAAKSLAVARFDAEVSQMRGHCGTKNATLRQTHRASVQRPKRTRLGLQPQR
jgi:hypothetical protein